MTAFRVMNDLDDEVDESSKEWRKNKLELEIPIVIQEGLKKIKTKTGFEY
jgi:hypothetical protein